MSGPASPPGQVSSTFYLLWLSQLCSLLGSEVIRFGLRVWAFESTHSVTSYAFITFCTEAPALVLAPLAGLVIDRCHRKTVIFASDVVAGLSSVFLYLQYFYSDLLLQHVYLTGAIQSICSSFQWPAFLATISLLVPPDKLTRYGGMNEAAPALSLLLAPAISGYLLTKYGLSVLFYIEFGTCVVATLVMLFARVPSPPSSTEGSSLRSLYEETFAACRFIATRPGLVALLAFVAIGRFASGMAQVLFVPVILSTETGDASVVGSVLTASGFGAVFGSVVMSLWGGPNDPAVGVVCSAFLHGLLHACIGLTLRPFNILLFAFLYMAIIPMVRVCRNAIWQQKTPADLQGRVFVLQNTIANAALPFASLVAGPTAQYVFEPLLKDESSALARTIVGRLVGIGQGRGVGLLFVVLGLGVCVASALGWMFEPLRHIQQQLPDLISQSDGTKKTD